jgi:hypothetical protein
MGYSEFEDYMIALSRSPAGNTADLEEVEGSFFDEPRGPVSIWFAGDGYLKLECELKTRGKKPVVCSFWGIQHGLHRKKREAVRRQAELAEQKTKGGQ